jgi:glycosyltransferase involved in cell wall biosynthesis
VLRDHSDNLRSSSPSICLVVPVLGGVNDAADIVRHYQRVAETLARASWKVHALICSAASDASSEAATGQRLQIPGVEVTLLSRMEFSPTVTLPGPQQTVRLMTADRVRYALARLHLEQPFSVVEFADRGALGFRCIQARRFTSDLAGAKLVVTLHGPTCLLRQQQGQWVRSTDDLTDDFCERHAVVYADDRFTVNAAIPQALVQLGWDPFDEVPLLSDIPRQYEAVLSAPPVAPLHRQPLVTVGVAHYNLGEYLPETLASLAAQSYPHLQVLVIDDGSTDPHAQNVFQTMRTQYPAFDFPSQTNAGIGATRNLALQLARGDYFLPMDADNIAQPDMIARLVAGLERNPDVAALSCYFLAFADSRESLLYCYRPTGGPLCLSALRNVHGDGNALFRTAALRAVAGFETDRDTSFEDWEVFVKLINAGFRVDVLPDSLFYYRRRDAGFSRATSAYRNHQRVLRQFVNRDQLPRQERLLLWNSLAGFQQRLEALEDENRALRRRLASRRYRVADWLHAGLRKVRSFFGLA